MDGKVRCAERFLSSYDRPENKGLRRQKAPNMHDIRQSMAGPAFWILDRAASEEYTPGVPFLLILIVAFARKNMATSSPFLRDVHCDGATYFSTEHTTKLRTY